MPYKPEELVPPGHPVCIVKQVVDLIDVKPINRKYNTINRFRSEKLSGILKQIFSQIVLPLAEQGIVLLKEAVFTDKAKAAVNQVAKDYYQMLHHCINNQ